MNHFRSPATHRARTVGVAWVSEHASSNFPGHEERMQAHVERVLRYYRSRPKTEGAQQVLNAVQREQRQQRGERVARPLGRPRGTRNPARDN